MQLEVVVFLRLPSERTLKDYTKNKPGFLDDVDLQLTEEIKQFKLSES